MASFNESCNDVLSWMNDKFDQLNQNNDSNNLRRLQNLALDLNPLDAQMKQLMDMAAAVKKAHPEQAEAIDRKMGELMKIYRQLKDKAAQRIKEAEESQGQQMFQNAVRDLLIWLEKTKGLLADDAKAVDVNR